VVSFYCLILQSQTLNRMSTPEFEQLIVKHNEYMRPFAVSLTKDAEDAADLCQETMLRALLYRDKYTFGTNLKAWLYTIMRNTFINGYRRSKRMTKIAHPDGVEVAFEAAGMAAQNEGYSRLRAKEIFKALEEIPSVFRLSFELYYTGYKYAEIAQMLDEPLGTIKSRIHFARKALSGRLER
jgi:RNA polymerase sigma factor (sigma-70 family)